MHACSYPLLQKAGGAPSAEAAEADERRAAAEQQRASIEQHSSR